MSVCLNHRVMVCFLFFFTLLVFFASLRFYINFALSFNLIEWLINNTDCFHLVYHHDFCFLCIRLFACLIACLTVSLLACWFASLLVLPVCLPVCLFVCFSCLHSPGSALTVALPVQHSEPYYKYSESNKAHARSCKTRRPHSTSTKLQNRKCFGQSLKCNDKKDRGSSYMEIRLREVLKIFQMNLKRPLPFDFP